MMSDMLLVSQKFVSFVVSERNIRLLRFTFVWQKFAFNDNLCVPRKQNRHPICMLFGLNIMLQAEGILICGVNLVAKKKTRGKKIISDTDWC